MPCMSAIHGNAMALDMTITASRQRLDMLGNCVVGAGLDIDLVGFRSYGIVCSPTLTRKLSMRAAFMSGME